MKKRILSLICAISLISAMFHCVFYASASDVSDISYHSEDLDSETSSAYINISFADEQGNSNPDISFSDSFWVVVGLENYDKLIGDSVIGSTVADNIYDNVISNINAFLNYDASVVSPVLKTAAGSGDSLSDLATYEWSTPYTDLNSNASVIFNNDETAGMISVVFEADTSGSPNYHITKTMLDSNNGELFRLKFSARAAEDGETGVSAKFSLNKNGQFDTTSIGLINKSFPESTFKTADLPLARLGKTSRLRIGAEETYQYQTKTVIINQNVYGSSNNNDYFTLSENTYVFVGDKVYLGGTSTFRTVAREFIFANGETLSVDTITVKKNGEDFATLAPESSMISKSFVPDAEGTYTIYNADGTLISTIDVLPAPTQAQLAVAYEVINNIADLPASPVADDATDISAVRAEYEALDELTAYDYKALVNNIDVLEKAEAIINNEYYEYQSRLLCVSTVETGTNGNYFTVGENQTVFQSDQIRWGTESSRADYGKTYTINGETVTVNNMNINYNDWGYQYYQPKWKDYLCPEVGSQTFCQIGSDVKYMTVIVYPDPTSKQLAAIYNAQDLIDSIPDTLKISDIKAIKAARAAYDAIPEEHRCLLTDYEKLTSAEELIVTVSYACFDADPVIKMISNLPDTPSSSDREAVLAAKAAYDGLPSSVKVQVTNSDKLLSCVENLPEDPYADYVYEPKNVYFVKNSSGGLNNRFIIEDAVVYIGDRVTSDTLLTVGSSHTWDDGTTLTHNWFQVYKDAVEDGDTYASGSAMGRVYLSNLTGTGTTTNKIWQMQNENSRCIYFIASGLYTICNDSNSSDMMISIQVYETPTAELMNSGDGIKYLIDSLGTADLTDEDVFFTELARTAYDNLLATCPAAAEKVTNLNKLELAEAAAAEVPENEEEDILAAYDVSLSIAALPDSVTLDNATEVHSVQSAYDSLTSEQKSLVINYEKLETANTTIILLEKEQAYLNRDLTVHIYSEKAYSVNDTDSYANYVAQFKNGDSVTVETTVTENFVGWVTEDRIIVSYKPVYSFSVTEDTFIYALYDDASKIPEGKSLVTYRGYNNRILFRSYLSSSLYYSQPLAMTRLGYKFDKWSMSVAQVLAAISEGQKIIYVTPEYVFDGTSYSITATGGKIYDVYGNISSVCVGAYDENGNKNKLTAIADAPESGKVFAYWIDDSDTILSYDQEYSFTVYRDVNLTAVYVDEGVSITPENVLNITTTIKYSEANKISFCAERAILQDNTVTGHGILLTTDSTIGTSSTDFVIDNDGIIKSQKTSSERSSVYVLTKSNVGTDTWYARAYVLYTDINGQQHVLYSDIVSDALPSEQQ